MNLLFLSLICLSCGLSVLAPLEKIANESYITTSGADQMSAIMSNTHDSYNVDYNLPAVNELIWMLERLYFFHGKMFHPNESKRAQDTSKLLDLLNHQVAALLPTIRHVVHILPSVHYDDVVFLQTGSYGDIDSGSARADYDFNTFGTRIVRRECRSCSADYQDIFYKRINAIPDGWSMYKNMYTDWSSAQNKIHEDFELYSTLEDACNKVNQWAFCNYNDPGIGFPRDCGIKGQVGGQWNSQTRGGHSVQFSIVASCF